jgi:uncharacterized protein YkwD
VIRIEHRSNALLLGVATGGLLLSGISVAAPGMGSPPAVPVAMGVPADVVAGTNSARRAAGCNPVRVDERLTATAQAHASDMARNGFFSQASSDGTTSAERIGESGYRNTSGENIASGYPTAAEVMYVWMGSASNRHTIEDCTFTVVGVGYDPDGHYWVQDFGS